MIRLNTGTDSALWNEKGSTAACVVQQSPGFSAGAKRGKRGLSDSQNLSFLILSRTCVDVCVSSLPRIPESVSEMHFDSVRAR